MNDEQRRKCYQRGCNLFDREYGCSSGQEKPHYYQQKRRQESCSLDHVAVCMSDFKGSDENERFSTPEIQSISPTKRLLFFKDSKLHPTLLRAVQKLGYITVKQVQMEVLSYFTKYPRASLKICAPRKCGKTTAIFLCIVNEILNDIEKNHNQALILCPTFELAEMCHLYALEMVKFSPLTLCLAVKGKNFNKSQKITENIIIATPDKASTIITSIDLKKIRHLFIDDADCLKNPKSLLHAVADIYKKMSRSSRIIVTTDSENPIIDDFLKEHIAILNVINIQKRSSYKNVKQLYVVYKNSDEKLDILVHFISTKICPGQIVIFCETTDVVHELEELLLSKNFNVVKLLGGLSSIKRSDVLKEFQNQEIKILITTQAFHRVIPSDHVTKVINFDQLFDEEGFLVREYEKRKYLLHEKSNGMFVNLVEKRYENFFFYEKKVLKNGKFYCDDVEIITVEQLENF